jgi:hypothetical protein
MVAVALLAGSAAAERIQKDNLIVSLDGGISPRELPRHRPAPVAVHLAGSVETADDTPLPRVNRLKLELAWRGILTTTGLPVCPRRRLAARESDQAIEVCSGALVGRGSLHARIFFPGQNPFGVRTVVKAFNGRTAAGRPAVLLHAYSNDPPASFVIPFIVKRKAGRTVLTSTLRRSVGTWPHVASFRVSIFREFWFKGKRHSYLKASCPAPRNFTAGFSYARATYTFADGKDLVIESVRSCRTR